MWCHHKGLSTSSHCPGLRKGADSPCRLVGVTSVWPYVLMYSRCFCMRPRNKILQGLASASLGWTPPFLPHPPPPPPNLQRFTWVCSGGHTNTGNQNAEREQIIERKMKAKYILGEMILSWSDNRAGGLQGWGRPEREPRCLAPGIHRYFLSYNWKPWNAPWFVFFNKHWWALCSVWFGLLVCICINHLKNGKIEKTIKIFL